MSRLAKLGRNIMHWVGSGGEKKVDIRYVSIFTEYSSDF